jgi:hypothetical protein
MFIKSILLKYSIPVIVAPHGCTDLVHAIQHNHIINLCKIYSISFVGSWLLTNADKIQTLDTVFIIASVIHFKRDIPKIYNISRSFIICCILFITNYYTRYLLKYYMIFIHVPNHYISNWIYLKKTPYLTLTNLIINTILIVTLFNKFYIPSSINNPFIHIIIKSVIISHIIYQEMFIHNNYNNNNNNKNTNTYLLL